MKKTGLVFLILMILVLVSFTDKANAGSVMIPVAEFTYDGTSGADTYPYFKSFVGGYLTGSDTRSCLVAPVKLPGNATKINKVIVYLIDEGTGAGFPFFRLTAIDMTTAFAEDYVDYNVTEGIDTIQGIELPLLKQKLVKRRVYQLGTCLYAGQYLYGVKVVYTVL